jgi:hypothetical protein
MMILHNPCCNLSGLVKSIIAWTCSNTCEGVGESVTVC